MGGEYMKENLLKRSLIFLIILIVISSHNAIAFTNLHSNKISLLNKYNDDFLDQYQTETENSLEAKIPFGINEEDVIILAQSFKPTYPMLTRLELLFKKSITNSEHGVLVSIKDNLEGDSLITFYKEFSEINSYPEWTEFDFNDINVIPENTYYIIVSAEASASLFIYQWYWGYDDGELLNNYDRGLVHISINDEWYDEERTDFCFKTYGYHSQNQPPIANFTWSPISPYIDEEIFFDASDSIDLDGTIIIYEWDWNNDGVFDEFNNIPETTHSWSSSGNYPVNLRIIDNDGLKDIKTKTVSIYDIIVPDDYSTIQLAVDHSEIGYSIFIRSNTYRETVIIDRPRLIIHGESKDDTIISGNGNDHVLTLLGDAYSTEVSGVTIAGDNYVKSGINSNSGIYVASDYNYIWDTVITSSNIGLVFSESDGNYIESNIIDDNSFGIHVDSNSHGNLIYNNIITSNSRHGVYIESMSIANNIVNNTILSNEEAGIYIDGISKGNYISLNNIKNNNIGVYCMGHSDGSMFHLNSLIDNSENNAFDINKDFWDDDSIGNYWSDYDGVDLDEDGIGDTPYYIPGGNNQDKYPLMHPWSPPMKPTKPIGPVNGKASVSYSYSTSSINPNGDMVQYGWDWNGDKIVDEWTNFYASGEVASVDHKWNAQGTYVVSVIAKGENRQSSLEWSDPLSITMPKNQFFTISYINSLKRFIDYSTLIKNILCSANSFLQKIISKNNIETEKNFFKNDYKCLTTMDIIVVPRDYSSIQEAVDHAKYGDMIKILAGTYYEHVIVDKEISIFGDEKGAIIIDGSGEIKDIFTIYADNVDISNLVIQNCDDASSGIRLYCNGSLIHNNSFNSCGSGIVLYDGVRPYFTLRNNSFFNNSISNCSLWGIYICGIDNVFDVFTCSNTSIENNSIISNNYGIFIPKYSSNIVISNNTIKDNIHEGISYWHSSSGLFFNNSLILNGGPGFKLKGSNSCTIEFNKISHVRNHSFEVENSSNNVIRNNIIGYQSPSLSSYLDIIQYWGIYIRGPLKHPSNNNQLYHNCFIKSFNNAFDQWSNVWDNGPSLGGNYWKDYDGMDSNGDGIGEIPHIIPDETKNDEFDNSRDYFPLMNCV